MPVARPHTRIPATATDRDEEKARNGTSATSAGSTSRVRPPIRSKTNPVASAETASTPIAAAYTTGTHATSSRPSATRWKDSTPNVSSPNVASAHDRVSRWKARGSGPSGTTSTCGRGPGAVSATRSRSSSTIATTPGRASTANPGQVTPVSASIARDHERAGERADLVEGLVHGEPPAAADGPRRVGEEHRLRRRPHRLARDRSRITSVEASTRPAPPTNGAKAISGTQTTVIAYPATVHDQYRPDRSASGPEKIRKPSAAASPAPVTRPTTSAEAPSEARNGPVTDRAPS